MAVDKLNNVVHHEYDINRGDRFLEVKAPGKGIVHVVADYVTDLKFVLVAYHTFESRLPKPFTEHTDVTTNVALLDKFAKGAAIVTLGEKVQQLKSAWDETLEMTRTCAVKVGAEAGQALLKIVQFADEQFTTIELPAFVKDYMPKAKDLLSLVRNGAFLKDVTFGPQPFDIRNDKIKSLLVKIIRAVSAGFVALAGLAAHVNMLGISDRMAGAKMTKMVECLGAVLAGACLIDLIMRKVADRKREERAEGFYYREHQAQYVR